MSSKVADLFHEIGHLLPFRDEATLKAFHAKVDEAFDVAEEVADDKSTPVITPSPVA